MLQAEPASKVDVNCNRRKEAAQASRQQLVTALQSRIGVLEKELALQLRHAEGQQRAIDSLQQELASHVQLAENMIDSQKSNFKKTIGSLQQELSITRKSGDQSSAVHHAVEAEWAEKLNAANEASAAKQTKIERLEDEIGSNERLYISKIELLEAELADQLMEEQRTSQLKAVEEQRMRIVALERDLDATMKVKEDTAALHRLEQDSMQARLTALQGELAASDIRNKEAEVQRRTLERDLADCARRVDVAESALCSREALLESKLTRSGAVYDRSV